MATILNGFAFESKRFVPDGGKPLIRIRDIFNDHTTVGYLGEYDYRYIVQAGELLVGMDGDFNCARWRGSNGLLNQRVCKIGPHPEEFDLDFLTPLLPGYLRAIHDVTSSTTVTHLSSRDVAKFRSQCLRLPNSTNSPGCSQQQHLSSTRVQATLRLLDERSSASGKPSSPLPARAALPLLERVKSVGAVRRRRLLELRGEIRRKVRNEVSVFRCQRCPTATSSAP